MAEFRPYQARGSIPIQNAAATRLDPSAGSLAGVQSAANRVIGLADAALTERRQTEDLQLRREASDYVTSQMGVAERDFTQRFLQAQEQAVGAATGFTPRILEEFDDYAQQQLEAAPNDYARAALKGRLDGLKTSLFDKAISFETGAKRGERAVAMDQSFTDRATAAYADPDRFEEILGGAIADINEAEKIDLTPGIASELRSQVKDRIAVGAMRGLIVQDPQAALADLTAQTDAPDNPIVAALSVSQRMELAGTARAEIARQDQVRSAARGGLSDRINGVYSVLKAGFPPDAEEIGRLRREVGALGPAGADLRADLARVERFSTFANEIRQWTPAEIRAWTQAEEGRLQAGGATPEDIARLGMAQSAEIRAIAGYGDVAARTDDMETVLSSGLTPPEARLDALVEDLTELGDTKALDRLQAAEAEGLRRKAMEDLPPPIAASGLAGVEADLRRSKNVTPQDVENLQSAKDMARDVAAALRDDAVSFGQRIGIVTAGVLDLSDPTLPLPGNPSDRIGAAGGEDVSGRGSAVEAMRKRRAETLSMAAKYGIEPTFLTGQEADLWKVQFDQAGVDDQLRLLQAVRSGFADRAPDVLEQIAKDGLALAPIGALLDDPRGAPVARDALRGFKTLAAETGRRPTSGLTLPVFDEVTDGLFVQAPETGARLGDLATAIYVARGGKTGPDFDDGAYQDAVQAALGQQPGPDGDVLGGAQDVNGAMTLVPRGVSGVQVERALRVMDDRAWARHSYSVDGAGLHAPRYGDGSEARAEDLAEAQLVPVGEDLYRVLTENGFLSGHGPAGYFTLQLGRRDISDLLGVGLDGQMLPVVDRRGRNNRTGYAQ